MNEWVFPQFNNSKNVLKFLELYAGASLQKIHLPILNVGNILPTGGILAHLTTYCSNINTLDMTLSDSGEGNYSSVWDKFQFPSKLQRFSLKLLFSELQGLNISEEIVPSLKKCPLLESVKFTNFALTEFAMKQLSRITSLQTLEVAVYKGLHAVDVSQDLLSIGCMTFLKSFKLCGVKETPDYDYYGMVFHCINIDDLLPAIAHWTNLRILSLYHLEYSDNSFKTMIPGLLNLETLELKDCSVTSEVVCIIGTHLKKLKSLTLVSQLYTSESLQSLSYHPMLEKLEVNQTFAERDKKTWVWDIYQILLTLPRIRKVKLQIETDIKYFFRHEVYPVIDSAGIEVECHSGQAPLGLDGVSWEVIEKEKKWKRKDISAISEKLRKRTKSNKNIFPSN